jgi:hypothetical protein
MNQTESTKRNITLATERLDTAEVIPRTRETTAENSRKHFHKAEDWVRVNVCGSFVIDCILRYRELLATCSIPVRQDHLLYAVRECLYTYNISAATLCGYV